jgi:hypothetical protein
MACKRHKIWTLAKPRPIHAGAIEKQTIIATCDAFIANVMKPRFLPVIRPTQFNYPIDMHGKWRAGRYRFMTRYRSGHKDNAGLEFDAPFARIDHMGADRFDLYRMRHTGQWWPLRGGLSLAESLRTIEEDNILYPL